MNIQDDRRGFALLLTLLVLVVLSVLLAAGFFLAGLELAAGRGLAASTRALGSAEQGIDALLSPWDPGFDSLPALVDTTVASGSSGGLLERRTLVRLMERLFLLRSEAIVTGPAGDTLARREVAAFVHTPDAAPVIRAALSVVDSVTLSSTASVSGVDSVPPWPGCGPPDSTVAALLLRDTTLAAGTPCPACLTGTPRMLGDTMFSAVALDQLGQAYASQLGRRADLLASGAATPLPIANGSSCAVAAAGNWGDPGGGTCGGWYPLIHAPGDLVISGGVGQGVLIVDGDLILGGGTVFAGLVVVRGRVAGGAGGGLVAGALRAGSADLRTPSGMLKIAYSTCVLRRVLTAVTRPVPLPGHWWIEVP